MKLYLKWIINEVARAMTKGEHTNERTYVRTYVRDRPYIPSTTLLCEGITNVNISNKLHFSDVYQSVNYIGSLGWLGGAMALGKLPVPGHPTIWITVRQGPTALAVGAGGGLFRHFYSHLSFLSSFSLSLGDGPI